MPCQQCSGSGFAKFWEAGSASKLKSQIRICIYIKVNNRELWRITMEPGRLILEPRWLIMEPSRFIIEPWKLTMKPWRVCRPVVVNLHHFDSHPHQSKNSDPDPHKREKWDPNLHYSEKSDPATRKVRQKQFISTYIYGAACHDPHQRNADP
jgi:hypothetical protein